MFRYLALATDPNVPGAASLARDLADSLLSTAGWRLELARPRLSVFCADAISGVNQAYRLHKGRGVVLGHLFRRHDRATSTTRLMHELEASDEVVESVGRLLVERYWGRYVALFESRSGDVHVLRDPTGALPCFRFCHRGVTIVFSWFEDVLRTWPQIPVPAVREDGLAVHLALRELTGRLTALAGVTQILSGEVVALGQMGGGSGSLIWDATEQARVPASMDVAEAMAALRDTVRHCAEAWAGCYPSILLRLSGGVDSSILASCLAKGRTSARVTCLNYHSVGTNSDEREFARLAAAAAGRDLVEYERDASFRLERALGVARTPTPSTYVGRLTSASDREVAETVGAPVMFTGAGGDQLFFEVRQGWPAADYLRQRGIDAGFPGAVLDAARLGRVSVWKVLGLAAADRFRIGLPPPDANVRSALISDKTRQQARQAGAFVHPAFVQPTNLPIGKLTQVQQLAYSAGYYDPYGVERAPELVNPMLSQPLVELCLKLPTFVLTHGGRGRGLARKAFSGEIPDAIARRRSKGGMQEHLKAVLAKNLEFAREMLLDGELVRRGLLDRAAVEAALSGRETAERTQVGEIHFCLGVEAWLQRWSPQTRRPS